MVGVAPPVLPTQRLGWSVFKTPVFKTRTHESVSGRILRVVDQPFSRYQWKLTWEILNDKSSLQELRILMDFFLRMQGKAGTFLYVDPSDTTVLGQVIGTGNGSQTVFPFFRSLRSTGAVNPIECAVHSPFTVYLNGTAQPSGWAFLDTFTGLSYAIQFTTPPGNGVIVSVDLSYYWPCHFMDDVNEFEEFMSNLWSLKELKFESLVALNATPVAGVIPVVAAINFQYIDLPPTANNFILIYTFGGSASIGTNFPGSWATAQVAATVDTIFDVAKNAVNFGTMTFAAGNPIASFAGSAQAFLFEDVLTIVPRRTDATLASISGVIALS